MQSPDTATWLASCPQTSFLLQSCKVSMSYAAVTIRSDLSRLNCTPTRNWSATRWANSSRTCRQPAKAYCQIPVSRR